MTEILIVADSAQDIQEVKNLLGCQEYQFFEVRDVDSAIDQIVAVLPDLVILDVETVEKSGYSICCQTRANPKTCRIPILAVCRRDVDKDNLLGWLEAGAEEYITKPFHVHELRARVRVLVRLKHQMDELEALRLHFEELSQRDALTGLHNRRYIRERMNEEFARARRYRIDMAILMMDIDHFKVINDRFGHPFGDRVLKDLVRVLSQNVRHSDLLARYGGEEFVAVLFETRQHGALNLAERVRSAVEGYRFSDGRHDTQATISIGVSVASGDFLAENRDLSWETLIARADEALYAAKADGRNCIRLHDGRQVVAPEEPL